MIVSRFEAIRDPHRLDAVRATGLLDTPNEECFDRLTRLASRTLRAPISLITLIEAERQFLKSSFGLPEPWASRRELPLSHSFCWVVVATGERFVISDARQHPLVASSPAIRELGIVAYVGLPLTVSDRPVLGTVCLADRQPREWTGEELQVLDDIAGLVADEIGRRLTLPGEGRRGAPDVEATTRTALLEALGEGICHVDRGGRCSYVNRTGAGLLGYQPGEVLGKDWHDLVHHSNADGSPCHRDECDIARSLASGRAVRSGETVFWRRDLTCFPVEYAIVPLGQYADADGVAMIFSDATASRKIQEEREHLLAREHAMRQEAETLVRRQSFLSQSSALISASLDSKDVAATVAALAVPYLADWCAVDAVRGRETVQRVAAAHVDPEKVSLVRELPSRFVDDQYWPFNARRIIRGGQAEMLTDVSDQDLIGFSRDVDDLTLLRAIGTRSVICAPLVAPGQILGAITVAHGASDRRYRQSDLLFVEELARRVATAMANARLHEEAVDAVRIRNELLTSVTHDLKNPLANIKGFTQLLIRTARQIEPPVGTEMMTWLTRIDVTTTKMSDLLEELLDVARQQTGQTIELERQPTDLVALVQQVADVYQQTTQQVRIRVESAVPSLIGVWDALRLERVLANLVSNAIKYSPDGGDVSIGVAVEDREDTAWAVVTVRDEGVGIPSADLPHVFERFYRASNVSGQSSGIGIGLASVRWIVEQHGGTVGVSSQEGVGTVFAVRLPLAVTPQSSKEVRARCDATSR